MPKYTDYSQEAIEARSYPHRGMYTITPKGARLGNILAEKMNTMYKGPEGDPNSPEWQEYLRYFYTEQALIIARSGARNQFAYKDEVDQALEELIEGGYIVRNVE